LLRRQARGKLEKAKDGILTKNNFLGARIPLVPGNAISNPHHHGCKSPLKYFHSFRILVTILGALDLFIMSLSLTQEASLLLLVWGLASLAAFAGELFLFRFIINPVLARIPADSDSGPGSHGHHYFTEGMKVSFEVEWMTAVWLVVLVSTVFILAFLIMTGEKNQDDGRDMDVEVGGDNGEVSPSNFETMEDAAIYLRFPMQQQLQSSSDPWDTGKLVIEFPGLLQDAIDEVTEGRFSPSQQQLSKEGRSPEAIEDFVYFNCPEFSNGGPL
jgi:hypothetical protein